MKAASSGLVLALLLVAGPGSAQEAIPGPRLAALKSASVFVVAASGPLTQSGSGFLAAKSGRRGWVVTNEHVVGLGPDTRVSLVFHAGTPFEVERPGTLVASDPLADLAVLEVESDALPDPLSRAVAPGTGATRPLWILGYPFGAALAAGKRRPEVTVSRAMDGGLRKGAADGPDLLLMDGEIHPGNSGGPVVDAGGGLAGVAVAKIHATSISFAVPASRVDSLLDGRVGVPEATVTGLEGGRRKIDIRVALLDPIGRLKDLAVELAEWDPAGPFPERAADGSWAPLGGRPLRTPLERAGNSARAEITVQAGGAPRLRFLLQLRWTTEGGRVGRSAPRFVFADEPDPKSGLEYEHQLHYHYPPMSMAVSARLASGVLYRVEIVLPANATVRAGQARVSPVGSAAPELGPDGEWRPIPGGGHVARLDPGPRAWVGEVPIAMDPLASREYYVQVELQLAGRDRPLYTAPRRVRIGGEAGAAASGPWIGGEPGPLPRGPSGEVVKSDRQIPLQSRFALDGRIKVLGLASTDLSPELAWDATGEHVFLLEREGVLRKVAVPEFREVSHVNLGRACGALDRGAGGLGILVRSLEEAWILDPATLAVRLRLPAPGATWLALSSSAPVAYAGSAAGLLSILDLAKGRVAGQVTPAALAEGRIPRIRGANRDNVIRGWPEGRMVPDGSALLVAERGTVHRFRIRGFGLEYEEVGRPAMIGTEVVRLELSPDSGACILAAQGGTPDPKRFGDAAAVRTIVYSPRDLSAPLVEIQSGPVAATAGFDPEGRRLWLMDSDGCLVGYHPGGTRAFRMQPSSRGVGEARRILVHPKGARGLILFGGELLWVEVPGAK